MNLSLIIPPFCIMKNINASLLNQIQMIKRDNKLGIYPRVYYYNINTI